MDLISRERRETHFHPFSNAVAATASETTRCCDVYTDGRAIRFLGSARRDYSLFVNIYFTFTNMSNTGDNGNTGDKEKEASVNTNGGNTASNSSRGPFLGYNLLTLFQLEVLLLMFIAISTLRYYVIVDAYSTLACSC
uniref:BRUSHY1-like n=1 Tax=Oryza sativa subsp. japonica TaxID=39947 RepID=Q5VNE3_ORYSJ|nr:BRUSHY1-like [Oryza sativa Japonica Group]